MILRPLHMLLLEDNPGDAELTREVLEANELKLELSVVVDGVQALDFLHRRGRYLDSPRPDLIVLDLNVPRLSGKEVLVEIKREANLRVIPVVILTSSSAEKDILESYQLGANCYITKPLDFDAFQTTLISLEKFWFSIVRLPPGDGARDGR
jgi:chemotaxis family two-component system response regulator Rcp1